MSAEYERWREEDEEAVQVTGGRVHAEHGVHDTAHRPTADSIFSH